MNNMRCFKSHYKIRSNFGSTTFSPSRRFSLNFSYNLFFLLEKHFDVS